MEISVKDGILSVYQASKQSFPSACLEGLVDM
jgi:hypothetical protein